MKIERLANGADTFEYALPAGRRHFRFARPCLLVSPAHQLDVRLAALALATGPVASLFVPKAMELVIEASVPWLAPVALFLPFDEWEAQSSLMPMRIPMSAEVHHRLLLFGAGRRDGHGLASPIEWPAVVRSRQLRGSPAQFHRRMACLHALERRIVGFACAARPEPELLRGLNTDASYGQFIRGFGMTPRRYLAEFSRRLVLARDVRGYQTHRHPLATGPDRARHPERSPQVVR